MFLTACLLLAVAGVVKTVESVCGDVPTVVEKEYDVFEALERLERQVRAAVLVGAPQRQVLLAASFAVQKD